VAGKLHEEWVWDHVCGATTPQTNIGTTFRLQTLLRLRPSLAYDVLLLGKPLDSVEARNHFLVIFTAHGQHETNHLHIILQGSDKNQVGKARGSFQNIILSSTRIAGECKEACTWGILDSKFILMIVLQNESNRNKQRQTNRALGPKMHFLPASKHPHEPTYEHTSARPRPFQ
jgi:hypothetical protein